MPKVDLPYPINDADNHFNEPPDCFERYIDPRSIGPRDPLRHRARRVASCSCSPGEPSKFHASQVTFSSDELEKMLGDIQRRHRRRHGATDGRRELGVVPGMLLNRLNPLRA